MLRTIPQTITLILLMNIPASAHTIPRELLTWRPQLTRQHDFDAFWSTATYQSALSSRPTAFDSSPSSVFVKDNRSTCHIAIVENHLAQLKIPVLHLNDWWADDNSIGPLEGNATSHVTILPNTSKRNGWDPAGLPDKNACELVRAVHTARHSLRHLLSHPDATQARAGIVGEGYGGAIAVALAAMDPELVAFVAIHEPVPGFHYLSDGTPADSRTILRPLNHLKSRNKQTLNQTLTYFDFFNFAPAVKCPVFVTMGDIDQVATAEQVLSIYNNLNCNKEIYIIEDDKHMSAQGRDKFYALTATWLKDLGFSYRPHPMYRGKPGRMHLCAK